MVRCVNVQQLHCAKLFSNFMLPNVSEEPSNGSYIKLCVGMKVLQITTLTKHSSRDYKLYSHCHKV